MSVLSEVLSANEAYAAEFGDKAQLALPPARHFAILTCMDARLDPAKYAGLAEGDAHVIRNAGGRASDDAIRSLVISYKLLGTSEWFVIHHTNCGMEFFTDEVMRSLLANSLQTAELDENGFHDVGSGPGSAEAAYVDWLTISDPQASVTSSASAAAPWCPETSPSTDICTTCPPVGSSRCRTPPPRVPHTETVHLRPERSAVTASWRPAGALRRGYRGRRASSRRRRAPGGALLSGACAPGWRSPAG